MNKSYICKVIDCPYFSDSVKNSFGCQFYSNAKSCHLFQGALSVQNTALTTDYEVIVIDLTINTALLKNENDAYVRESNRYAKDKEFMKMFPDLSSVNLPNRIL